MLQCIGESDSRTRYDFWTHLEAGEQKGRWEGPPYDPYMDYSSDPEEDDSPSSKRKIEADGSTAQTDVSRNSFASC